MIGIGADLRTKNSSRGVTDLEQANPVLAIGANTHVARDTARGAGVMRVKRATQEYREPHAIGTECQCVTAYRRPIGLRVTRVRHT